jgi:HEXXH motif-containing protein
MRPRNVPAAMDVIDHAEGLIGWVPSLWTVIQRCIREIFLLRVDNDCYDVSHSDPKWVDRIFISVPNSSVVADLRVAEALVHEAMHLNLTNVERCFPLVTSDGALYSPWKEERLPASGVLHGLYVFACISRFMKCLSAAARLDDHRHQHASRRIKEIHNEIASVDRNELGRCLTPLGATVVSKSLSEADA